MSNPPPSGPSSGSVFRVQMSRQVAPETVTRRSLCPFPAVYTRSGRSSPSIAPEGDGRRRAPGARASGAPRRREPETTDERVAPCERDLVPRDVLHVGGRDDDAARAALLPARLPGPPVEREHPRWRLAPRRTRRSDHRDRRRQGPRAAAGTPPAAGCPTSRPHRSVHDGGGAGPAAAPAGAEPPPSAASTVAAASASLGRVSDMVVLLSGGNRNVQDFEDASSRSDRCPCSCSLPKSNPHSSGPLHEPQSM